MPRITYFQRYSTPENAVTNTTLHLFSQIYRHSPDRLKEFLSELFGNESIPLGVEFVQQTRFKESVPDGGIHQESVHIQIETKVTAGVDADQLIRHCKSFNPNSQGNFLVLLTKAEVSEKQVESVLTAAKDHGAIFCKTTFEGLCHALKNIAQEHETHLKSIAEDYIAYCAESRLLVDRRSWLSIVPCGSTYTINEKWMLYYQPTERGYNPQDYLGIYTRKAVRLVGQIAAIYDNYLDDGRPCLKFVSGEDRPEFRERVTGMVKDTHELIGWNINSGYRFFCVAEFVGTEFKKTSPNGIMGGRYWDISEQVKMSGDVHELARVLAQSTWG